eukprot:gene6827-7542_t
MANAIPVEPLSSQWLEYDGKTKLVLCDENSTILDGDFGARLCVIPSPVPSVSSPTAIHTVLSRDGSDRIAYGNASDMVEIYLQRKSRYFSVVEKNSKGVIVSPDYEAPLMDYDTTSENSGRREWMQINFFRLQPDLLRVEEGMRRHIVDYINANLQERNDESRPTWRIKYFDIASFYIHDVKVILQIRRSATQEILPIKQVQPCVDFDENGKWRSCIDVEYLGNSSKVRYDITSYQDHIRGRLLLGRGQFSANNQKEVYRGVLDKNGEIKEKVAVKILNCRLKVDWQGAVQGITLDDLVIDDVGDSIVREIAIMQEIAESLLPNREHPHLALDVKGIYTTVSDKQRTGHLLIAFPYQSNSSLLSFLDSKKYKSSDSKQKLKMIRFITKDIAMGLQQLHELGYAHLDLTPENIVVTDDYHFKLIDFGQARKTDVEVDIMGISCKEWFFNPAHLELNGENEILLSEERLRKFDMWNVGIILFQALFGTTCEASMETVERETNDLEDPVIPENLEERIHSLKWVKNSDLIFASMAGLLGNDQPFTMLDGLEVVEHLLDHNEKERWNGSQVLEHIWSSELREEERHSAFNGVQLNVTMTGKRDSGTTMMTRNTHPRHG